MESQKYLQPEPQNNSAEQSVHRWIDAYFVQYLTAMLEHTSLLREEARSEAARTGFSLPDRLFDPELRLLEEMPICSLWSNWSLKNPVPEGFGIVNGSVLLEDEFLDFPWQTRRADHQYLEMLDGSGVILDHCAGQFYWRRSEDVPKGTRLAAIDERAGSLLSKFTNEAGESHTFLIGTRSEITARLGLRYDTVPRYES